MHIPQEMYQELERLIRAFIYRIRHAPHVIILIPLFQYPSRIPYPTKEVGALAPSPSALPGEYARLRRVVAHGTDIVQRCGPSHLEPDAVSPGGNRGQVARWFVRVRGREVEDITYFGEHGRVKVDLGDGSDYFVA